MARQLSAKKELDDLTECSICTDVFTDPRVLPCIHTFCLKCLMNYGKDRPPGDDMPCPLCRKMFTIPEDGLSEIQKNFFVEKLRHARQLLVEEEASCVLCDVCVDREQSGTETSECATMYCVQCQRNYCEQCSRSHAGMKLSAGHVQVKIGKQLKKEEIALKLPATCDIHQGKEIDVFCLECELAICVMCFIKSHKTHDCSDIEEVSVNLRKQMKGDTGKVTQLLKETREVLPRIEKEKRDLIKHLAGIEYEITTKAEKLIAAIQRDRVKLLSEVESIKLKRVKQLETVKQEVEQHMAALESFKRHSEMLLSSGTACDVTRSGNSLHDRANELMMYDVISHVDRSLPSFNVSFLSPTALDKDNGNLIGSIIETDEHLTPKNNRENDCSYPYGLRRNDLDGDDGHRRSDADFASNVDILRRRVKDYECGSSTTVRPSINTLQYHLMTPKEEETKRRESAKRQQLERMQRRRNARRDRQSAGVSKADTVPGYRGNASLEELINYIDAPAMTASHCKTARKTKKKNKKTSTANPAGLTVNRAQNLTVDSSEHTDAEYFSCSS